LEWKELLRTLETRHELAGVLHGLGKYREALELEIYEKVLSARKKTLGGDDSDTLETQHVMAEQGRNDEALGMFEEVYKFRKESLGIQDEETLETVCAV
jgi:hypothetical protein